MPELPEVEVVKQSLEKYILNKHLIKIVVKNNKLRFPVPKNISKKLSNLKTIKVNQRWGSHHPLMLQQKGNQYDLQKYYLQVLLQSYVRGPVHCLRHSLGKFQLPSGIPR